MHHHMAYRQNCSLAAASLRRESSVELLLQAAVSCWRSGDYEVLGDALRGIAATNKAQCSGAGALWNLGPGRCTCTLVDVGLNDGGTLLQWPKTAAAVLARRGGAEDQRLSKSLRQCVATPAETCYTGFEMQARYTVGLREQERSHRRAGGRVQLFTETAFSTSSNPVEAYVDPLGGGTGTSLVGDVKRTYRWKDAQGKGHRLNSDEPLGSNFTRTHSSLPAVVQTYLQQPVVRTAVAAIDAGDFLCEATARSDFVAIKLDVEAFEFSLLPSLILKHPAELARLPLLAAEWHESSLVGERRQQVPDGAQKALAWLLSGPLFNTTVLDWM